MKSDNRTELSQRYSQRTVSLNTDVILYANKMELTYVRYIDTQTPGHNYTAYTYMHSKVESEFTI